MGIELTGPHENREGGGQASERNEKEPMYRGGPASRSNSIQKASFRSGGMGNMIQKTIFMGVGLGNSVDRYRYSGA